MVKCLMLHLKKVLVSLRFFQDAKKRRTKENVFRKKCKIIFQRIFSILKLLKKWVFRGRVYVQFIIDTDSSVTRIRAIGPDKNLEREAYRIISKLPKMTPGKIKGRPVRVPFTIPITFRIEEPKLPLNTRMPE